LTEHRTITLRGEIANPILHPASTTGVTVHEMTDGEFVTFLLEGVQPVEVVAIPRSAVLSDSRATMSSWSARRTRPSSAGSNSGSRPLSGRRHHGLTVGDKVIVEGLQRVRLGQPVAPGPRRADPSQHEGSRK